MMWNILEIYFAILCISNVNSEIVHTTKFFILPIEPKLFNWTLTIGHDFEYHSSLLRAPDLPNWIQYMYSKRHRTGFLYGVPPPKQNDFEIEIIALNRRTYETRRRVVHLNVFEKTNSATHQVHLKIDNVNVDDFFDAYRLNKLLDIFRYKLWKDSFPDLYVTFMTSAVNQGARRPLKPNESEGVVMRLGSGHSFSNNLLELQDQVKPLWKLHSCPRDYKRTTVERWFREEGFALDWCSFKLITDSKGNETPVIVDILPPREAEDMWKPVYRATLPQRSYSGEFAVTILVPMFILILLFTMLSFILCLQHDGMDDESEAFFQSLFIICEDYTRIKKKSDDSEITAEHYGSPQPCTGTRTLRSLSRPRDSTPPLFTNDDDVSRPNPPPYSGGTLRRCQGEF